MHGQIIRRTKIPIVDDNNGKYDRSIIRCEYQLNRLTYFIGSKKIFLIDHENQN